MGRSEHALEIGEDVTVGVGTAGKPFRQVDGDGLGGPGKAQRVVATAAVQRVSAAGALDRVVAGIAGDLVGIDVADQQVPGGPTEQVLDIGEPVAFGVAALAGPHRHVDGDAEGRGRVIERVFARTAVDAVLACATGEDVVALTGQQRIGATPAGHGVGAITRVQEIGETITGQPVVFDRTDDVGNPRQHVAFGVAALADAAGEVHGDGRHGRRIVGRVGSTATRQGVGALTAREHVVAGVARDPVGPDRPDDVLEAGDDVALGESAGGRAGRKRHRDGALRHLVRDRVVPGATVERVAARTRDNCVVARGGRHHRAGRGRPQHHDLLARLRILEDGVLLVGDFADAEGADTGDVGELAGSGLRQDRDVEVEPGQEPVGIGFDAVLRDRVLEVDVDMVRLAVRIQRDEPGVARLGAVGDGEPVRQVHELDDARLPAGGRILDIRRQHARRTAHLAGLGRVVGIDAVV